jgi:hypothetical protein
MSIHGIDHGQDIFWEAIAARLIPYLGNVEHALGLHWAEKFESYFSKADFAVLQTVKRLVGKVPVWYVIRRYEALNDFINEEDPVLAGESRAHCIAFLLEHSKEYRALLKVVYDEQADQTVFLREGKPWATVGPVENRRCVNGPTRTRVESTLVKLRKNGAVQEEFAKRLARWPHLSGIRTYELGNSKPEAHWPCPAEWLLSSQMMLNHVGATEPTTALVQALAAAAFGFTSWNQLCSLLPKAEKSDWWSFYSAYLVRGEHQLSQTPIAVFSDPIEAFLEFCKQADKVMTNLRFLESNFSSDIFNFPVLKLTSPDDELRSAHLKPTTIVMKAVTKPPIDCDKVNSVLVATHADYIGGLRGLLCS